MKCPKCRNKKTSRLSNKISFSLTRGSVKNKGEYENYRCKRCGYEWMRKI